MNTTKIIVGHSGSGKTEFAVNYALQSVENGKEVVVVDLDIVNPYFRSREVGAVLSKGGVRVISSNLEDEFNIDTPALAAEIGMCFAPSERLNIIDVGGDSNGALALARYSWRLQNVPYDMWMVVNANRLQTQNAEGVIEFIEKIEAASNLKVNGLINTTHMLQKTSLADLEKGEKLARDVSEKTGLPIVYTAGLKTVIQEASPGQLSGEILPIEMIMRPDWLD